MRLTPPRAVTNCPKGAGDTSPGKKRHADWPVGFKSANWAQLRTGFMVLKVECPLISRIWCVFWNPPTHTKEAGVAAANRWD
ncbi:hypothetical protein NDU88_008292 [Pleurodeles waltl]|uniref:Uncharacterized protein n=1 Tax=Pleurodeles waltl TaxID=8319 RepID=A0AAV7N4I5_PLEWA|nr:hypothetical protein NDU88_008292 [Pleurodeles waltl]